MHWGLVYLGIGVINWGMFAARGGVNLKPRENTLILGKGRVRSEQVSDVAITVTLEALFFILLWPVQLAFAAFVFIVMPIIDFIGKKEWTP